MTLWSSPADATRVQRLTLTQMKEKATTVIVGTVTDISTRIGAGGKMVWTDYTLNIENTLVGATQDGTKTVSFAGGQKDGLDVGILGVPRLELGKRYVLFLQPKGNYPTATVGWGQGIYQVMDIQTGTTARTVLVSYGSRPLELDAEGSIFRGAPVMEQNGVLRRVSAQRESTDESPKAPEPIVYDAAGNRVPQVTSPPQEADERLSKRRFASVDALRRFLNGELQESLLNGR